jgi:phosphopantothenoylcysteine decarboxylase/phosphopantothenate--cysteine ligase
MGKPIRHYLITAGPTHEPIDAVRYLANRSSGRMGIALAEAARARGAAVTLLLGPVPGPVPGGVTVRRFTRAADLGRLLDEHFPQCDVLIMAAAVADFTPENPTTDKLSRTDQPLRLTLEPTTDLVGACAARKRDDQRIIAFALEPADRLVDRARAKLHRKAVDAIVANPLKTMDQADVEATLLTPAGPPRSPGAMPKTDFARWLIQWIEDHGFEDSPAG